MSLRVVVMGVAGSGKSSLADPLARELGARCVEGDDLHPEANIAKMSAGIALTDDDRHPWLDRIATELVDAPVVVTCSALRRDYRDILRRVGGVGFVYLAIDEPTALARLHDRVGHFMRSDMVQSQFATLEIPTADEIDVVHLDGSRAVDEQLRTALAHL